MDKEDMKIVITLMDMRRQLNEIAYKSNDTRLKANLLRCIKELRFATNYLCKGEEDMNKSRRTRLNEARTLLNQANNIIEDVMNEEDFAFNNLSDGLQQTMRGEQMEENVNEMEEAMESIEEAISNLDNVM